MAPEAGQTRRASVRGAARDQRGAGVVRMSTAGRAAAHALGLYGRTLHAALRLIGSAEAEARHLHAVEQEGDAAATPFIAILGLFLFFLPLFLVIVGLAFAASYLA
jgi:hypothetical protein